VNDRFFFIIAKVRCLLAHPSIADCAVVGVPDAIQGERVAAIIEMKKVVFFLFFFFAVTSTLLNKSKNRISRNLAIERRIGKQTNKNTNALTNY
jgi:acyl-coenzyme A synthetase/AMP-(fatty) acid ligase